MPFFWRHLCPSRKYSLPSAAAVSCTIKYAFHPDKGRDSFKFTAANSLGKGERGRGVFLSHHYHSLSELDNNVHVRKRRLAY